MTRFLPYLRNTIIAISILGLTFTSIANATNGNSGTTAAHSSTHHVAGRSTHHTTHSNKTVKTNSAKKKNRTVKPKVIKKHSAPHKLHKPSVVHKTKRVTKQKVQKHPIHKNKPRKGKLTKHKPMVRNHTTKSLPVKPVVAVQAPSQNNTLTKQQLSLNTLSPAQNDGQRLVSFVRNIVSSLRYTRYASGAGTFDSKYGVYKLDCSHYVDNILHRVDPRAYASLETATGAPMPSSANYYEFFTRLSSDIRNDWDRIDNAKELQPGDVLVFRYKESSGEEGGHVMVVMNKPVIDNDALVVQVSDSAAAGHSDDTRPAHNSGVGIGTLLLKVDSYTGQPSAYAWEFNAPWKNVNVAMARPLDFG